ncbi:cytochrome c biogenesis CcdA family protein [Helicobacter sp. MIT 99-5507]|uniref:cytochrome c biogenesis CcdA family protein n=1 Tax=Helicobacter sp. MIT 99-5507 TaxID=152489 RepID=UPI000E1E7A1E|nr:cytochrome c biogenesis protein CcdA [Helicobacter sp. MIT 99-5507]RDU57455.1 cytochrome C biogenesis protein [Helicobacter sp. MIT 99-5507]
MELLLFNLFEKLPYSISFLAGILTFLSPCVLPLIPPYMSYISGISIQELQNKSLKNKIVIFQKALLFVFGFSIIFILIGMSFNTLLGRILGNNIINYIAGGIIVLFGIHFLGIIKFGFLYKTKKLDSSKLENIRFLKYISPFILGVVFALGWSPCVGPILSSIMVLSSTNKAGGLSFMIVYASGLAVPFLLTALAIEKFFRLFNKIKKYSRMIEILSGILLIAIGIIIAFGGLDRLNELIS